MIIETKFRVGDIVGHIFDHQKDGIRVMQVMEVDTNTCYAGTQIFYQCRAILLKLEDGVWETYSTRGDNSGDTGFRKYREDELAPASDKAIKILNGESVADGETTKP